MASQAIPGFSWRPVSASHRWFAQASLIAGAWLLLLAMAVPVAGCAFAMVTGNPANSFLAGFLCIPPAAVLTVMLAYTSLLPTATGRILCSYVAPASALQLDGVRDLLGKVPQEVAAAVVESVPNPELLTNHDVHALEEAVASYLRGIETSSTLRDAVDKLGAEIGRHRSSRV